MNAFDKARVVLKIGVDPIDGLPGHYRGVHEAPRQGYGSKTDKALYIAAVAFFAGIGVTHSLTTEPTTAATPERAYADDKDVAEAIVEDRLLNKIPIGYAPGDFATLQQDGCTRNPVVQQVHDRVYLLQIGRTDSADPTTVTAVVEAEVPASEVTETRQAIVSWVPAVGAYAAASAFVGVAGPDISC
jgi:hypothetical protein